MNRILTSTPDMDRRVWVQQTPLIVDELCTDPLEVAAWRALDWLMTVFPQRRGFGSREIADRAHVSRKTLTRRGKRPGLIDRLVEKGLIDIVGYELVGFPNPRPIYAINHEKLLRASLDAAPRTLLRFRATEPPPPPHPDQLTMFDRWQHGESDGPLPGPSAPHGDQTPQGHGALRGHGDQRPQGHGDQRPQEHGALRGHGDQCFQFHGDCRGHGEPHGDIRGHAHGACVPHQREREREEKREGVIAAPTADSARFPPQSDQETPDLRALIREELRAALGTPQPQPETRTLPAASSAPIPAAPPDSPALSAHPRELWQDLHPLPRAIDLRLLDTLGSEHDSTSGGFGSYWVGRAILAVALTQDAPPVRLIKAVLDRWRATATYGSDAPSYERRTAQHNAASPISPAAAADAPASAADTSAVPAPAPEQAETSAVQHYRERFGRMPNLQQAIEIAHTVQQMEHWQATLDEWLLNGWKPTSVGHMLDHYQKRVDAATPVTIAPLIEAREQGWIDGEEVSDWLGQFNGTPYQPTSPTEKRAVLRAFAAFLQQRKEAHDDPRAA